MCWHEQGANPPDPVDRDKRRQCGGIYGRWRLAENSLLDVGCMPNVRGDVLMKIRRIQWRSAFARPVVMPSVECPRVHIYGAEGYHTEWMGCSRCLGCALCERIEIDVKNQTGAIHCAG